MLFATDKQQNGKDEGRERKCYIRGSIPKFAQRYRIGPWKY